MSQNNYATDTLAYDTNDDSIKKSDSLGTKQYDGSDVPQMTSGIDLACYPSTGDA
jgi:hypothetical protein